MLCESGCQGVGVGVRVVWGSGCEARRECKERVNSVLPPVLLYWQSGGIVQQTLPCASDLRPHTAPRKGVLFMSPPPPLHTQTQKFTGPGLSLPEPDKTVVGVYIYGMLPVCHQPTCSGRSEQTGQLCLMAPCPC